MSIKSKEKLKGDKADFRKGFSLIETAIVLIIMGLLLGLGIRSCMSGIETAKIDNTRNKLLTFKSFILNEFCKTGNLPEKSEMDPYYLKDAWNRDIELIYTSGVKSNNPCFLKSTTLSLTLPEGNKIEDVVAVIISSAMNKVLDSNVFSNQVEIRKDDLWEYITLYELKTKCCKGKEVKILTDSLPPIVQGENYEVFIAVEGGKPPYECSISIENGTVEGGDSYCKIALSEDYTKELSSNEILITLTVEDSSTPALSTSKDYPVTVIRRKL
jgi:prepilin-type N-terminal cleavage/methylation domain-containing protein